MKYYTLFFIKLRKRSLNFVVCCSVFLKELIEKKEVIFEKKESANLKNGMKSMPLQICWLLLTFANNLDPGLAKHNFQSNLEQKMFGTRNFLFFLKKKIRRRQQSNEKLPSMQRVN